MSKKDLSRLYDNAFTIPFNDEDKIVFMSDVHRGDGTYYDALLNNRNIYLTALRYYLRNNFIYVEVGDGDELWKNRDFTEIAYAYESVFRVFNKFSKKDRIFIIYGNHDIIKSKKNFKLKQEKCINKIGTKYGNEFMEFIDNNIFYEGINFLYTPLNEKFLVTHGHQIDITNSTFKDISKILVRYIWKFMYGIAGFRDPTNSAKSKNKRTLIDNKLQQWVKENGKMLICGHTHNSRFPDLYEPPYFNDGCCVYPYAMTAIEIEKGEIKLVKWIIDAQETGSLWVTKKDIAGPVKVAEYLKYAQEERLRRKNK